MAAGCIPITLSIPLDIGIKSSSWVSLRLNPPFQLIEHLRECNGSAKRGKWLSHLPRLFFFCTYFPFMLILLCPVYININEDNDLFYVMMLVCDIRILSARVRIYWYFFYVQSIQQSLRKDPLETVLPISWNILPIHLERSLAHYVNRSSPYTPTRWDLFCKRSKFRFQ